jgi:transposase
MKEAEGRFVGIDLAKRSYVARLEPRGAGRATILEGRTDEKGIVKLCSALGREDRVAIECCALGFWLARELIARVGCDVLVLNAGQLAIIYKSTKKTDLNDAQKLAWVLKRLPREELPVVPLPSVEEEERRAMVSGLHSKKGLRTELVNRLHSLLVRVGQTGMARKDLVTAESRRRSVQSLAGRTAAEAGRMLEEIEVLERHIAESEIEVAESLVGDRKAELLLAIPGVGPATAIAFLAHVGDGERFANARQVSNYVGMTPRVYASGETMHIGRISKRGCVAIRSVIVQSAWAAVHTKRSNVFKTKYEELVGRLGKKRAIVAIARRMLETMWIVIARDEMFRGYDELQQRLKLRIIEKKAKKAQSAA